MGFLRNYIFKALYYSGTGKLLLSANRKKKKIPVLVFHKITPERDDVWPGIHPRLFEQMIIMLKKHYSIRPLNDLLDKDPDDLTDSCFVTFDDGYKDYLEYAFPIMKKHGVHSSVFVLPFDMSNNGHIWTSTTIYFVKNYTLNEILDFLKDQKVNIDLGADLNKFEVNLVITRHLRELEQNERQSIIRAMQHKFIRDGKTMETELLTFDELKSLDSDLVSVESHSLTHPSFKNETIENFIDHELKYSKKLIELKHGNKVNCFAFPFAKSNNLAIAIARKYYRMCFTRIDDSVDLEKLKTDKDYYYDLPRYNVHQDSPEEMFLMINGFHQQFKRRFLNR